MKKFTMTLLVLSAAAAALMPITTGAAEDKDSAAEPTRQVRTDLFGNTVITGDSEVIYDIGAPLLNASFKPDGDSYTMELSTLDGFVIYYTADGSTPLPGAKNTSKYTAPVKLEAGGTKEDKTADLPQLRVVVVDPNGKMDGAVASSYFSNIDEKAIATPEPDKFTARFNSDGGSDVQPQTVYVGTKLTEPQGVQKSGYTFSGWFKDELHTKQWNFGSDVLNEDVTLYAKWLSADIEISSIYHVVDRDAKTITPDKNSSTSEFIRKIRFPNNSTYKLTLKDGTTEASAAEPVQEGMILSVTAQDARTSVTYTVKSTVTGTGEVIAPVLTSKNTD